MQNPLGCTECSSEIASRFIIEGELGSGGFGKVFRAYDNYSKEVVALKVLLAPEIEEEAKRLRREFTYQKEAKSPHVVEVYDSDQSSQSFCWFTMQVANDSLSTMAPILERCEHVQLVQDILHALTQAHSKNILHRDIHPANILWFAEERCWKLSDFGLARRFSGHSQSKLSIDAHVRATLLYAAPELETDPTKAQAAADYFSIGKVIGWLVSGKRPAPGEPTQLPESNPWHELVLRMTDKRIDRRLVDQAEIAALVTCIGERLRSDNLQLWRSNALYVAPPAVSNDLRELLFEIYVAGSISQWVLRRDTRRRKAGEMTPLGIGFALDDAIQQKLIAVKEDDESNSFVSLTDAGKALIKTLARPSDLRTPAPPPENDNDFTF